MKMILHPTIIALITAILIESTKANWNQYCGIDSENGNHVPYPFGFSDRSPIRLNCRDNGDISIGEFQVLNFSSDYILVSLPANCDRPILDIQQLIQRNLALTLRNSFLLQNCSSPLYGCMIPSMMENLLQLLPRGCESRNESICCYSEDNATLGFFPYESLNRTNCRSVFTSIVVSNTSRNSAVSLELQSVELGWWVDGPCKCVRNAICSNVSSPNGSSGFRCRCREGFDGDGFVDGDGCRKVENRKLCGGIESLGLPECQISARTRKRKSIALKVATLVALSCLILLACLFATLYRIKKPARKPSTRLLVNEQFPQISYADLLRATNGFSSFNLLGEGSYGSVYKGTLTDGMIVAVKVFNLKRKGASKSFMAECRALRNIRHRNLLKIVTACSSIDSKGDDFKAIVSEFMPNRSLQDWLHPPEDEQLHNRYLSLAQRLSITMDVASAVEYLHHRGQTSIIHGDLKPSNVLLDHDMNAHVGDFGLARFLPDRVDTDSSQNQTSSSSVKGTVGYVAPEYGIGGNATMQGDVYSFGILLLEMFTGRRPTDSMFKDGLTLHSFTKMALPERVMMTVEPSLLLEGGDNNDVENNNRSMTEMSKIEECLLGVLKIGVSCSMESPGERMDMKDVVAEMHKISKLFGTRI